MIILFQIVFFGFVLASSFCSCEYDLKMDSKMEGWQETRKLIPRLNLPLWANKPLLCYLFSLKHFLDIFNPEVGLQNTAFGFLMLISLFYTLVYFQGLQPLTSYEKHSKPERGAVKRLVP